MVITLLIAQTPVPPPVSGTFSALLVLGALVVVLKVALRRSGTAGSRSKSRIESITPPDSDEPDALPYQRRPYLLTKAERSFYEVLRRVVGPSYSVFAKVRLSDLVSVPRGTRGWQAHFNRAQAKHVDFVVCDGTYLRPIVVVELDDSSHEAAARQDRDRLVDRILAAAGFPIVRVPAQRGYVSEELRLSLKPHLLSVSDAQPEAVS